MHVVIGLVLALFYAASFATRLPGGPALRGAICGLMIAGSLMGHLVYGALVGLINGDPVKLGELSRV